VKEYQEHSLVERCLHFLNDNWVEVAGEHCAEAHREIEKLATIDICHVGALG